MRIIDSSDTRAVARLLRRRRTTDPAVRRRVSAIVADVRARGDRALLAYARRLDGLDGHLEIGRDEMQAVAARTPADVRQALRLAARHIGRVARRQLPRAWRVPVRPGIAIEQQVRPLASVGCYVPGGRYPLPSSLLMSAIPARVAGVGEIVVACPRPEPAVLAAALEAGVTRVFRMGGAHAIAALAYGTGRVPRVEKIVGPGNVYVAAAKARVAVDCAVDFPAGPTELVTVARRGRARWIAADLIAQAEHDPEARVLLLTPNRRLAVAVAAELRRLAGVFPAAREALARHGAIVVTRETSEALSLADRLAPEHLVCGDETLVPGARCAGTVFVGDYAAPALGDYVTGSNHVLPTGGAARVRGGLGPADFVRVMTVQRVTRRGLAAVASAAVVLARAEGLEAHAASIQERLRQ